MSIPLGLFDRNKGAIARADAEKREAEYQRRAGDLRLARDAARAIGDYKALSAAARALKAEALPKAESALASARAGYAQGAFSYLDVMNAQRALFDLKTKETETRRGARTAKAQFDRLTARYAASTPDEETRR